MKECLNCKQEYKPQRPHSKFCSTKCRVMHNRKNPKGVVTPVQLDVLYNSILDTMAKVNAQLTANANMAVPAEYFGKPEAQPTDRYNDFYDLLAKADGLDALEGIGQQIEASDLPERKKKMLHSFGKQRAKDFY